MDCIRTLIVASMLNYPVAKNIKDVRRFVGMVSWYRRFISNFDTRVVHLVKLTRKNEPFVWHPESEAAFRDVKHCLVEAPILTCPDFNKSILQTDASQIGLVAVLTQNFDDSKRVISYASNSLTLQKLKYSTTELEFAAVLF